MDPMYVAGLAAGLAARSHHDSTPGSPLPFCDADPDEMRMPELEQYQAGWDDGWQEGGR